MEQHHRKLINDNLLKLSNYTIDTESIINQLFERGVINDWMKNDILVNICHLLLILYDNII